MQEIKILLDALVEKYNKPEFIEMDPISIPHNYSKLQDIEITAFITATLSWGNRKSIINSAKNLFELMDNAPYDFIMNYKPKDLKKLSTFKHRTFQYTDTLGFVAFLKNHYSTNKSLESAFLEGGKFHSVKESIIYLNKAMFVDDKMIASRTQKHVANPARKSTCKRLNMMLRWMVRKDDKGVDFGLWKKIPMSSLMIPLDVHVDRVARQMGLIKRKQRDWQTVEELTSRLRQFEIKDPVKYDFALFSMGINL